MRGGGLSSRGDGGGGDANGGDRAAAAMAAVAAAAAAAMAVAAAPTPAMAAQVLAAFASGTRDTRPLRPLTWRYREELQRVDRSASVAAGSGGT